MMFFHLEKAKARANSCKHGYNQESKCGVKSGLSITDREVHTQEAHNVGGTGGGDGETGGGDGGRGHTRRNCTCREEDKVIIFSLNRLLTVSANLTHNLNVQKNLLVNKI